MKARLRKAIEGLEPNTIYIVDTRSEEMVYERGCAEIVAEIHRPRRKAVIESFVNIEHFLDFFEVLQVPSQETIETITVCINNNMDEMFNQIKENPNVRPDLIKTFYVQNTSEHIKTVLSGGTE